MQELISRVGEAGGALGHFEGACFQLGDRASDGRQLGLERRPGVSKPSAERIGIVRPRRQRAQTVADVVEPHDVLELLEFGRSLSQGLARRLGLVTQRLRVQRKQQGRDHKADEAEHRADRPRWMPLHQPPAAKQRACGGRVDRLAVEDATEVLRKFSRRRVASPWVDVDGLQAHRFGFPRDLRMDGSRSLGLSADDALSGLGRGGPEKRRLQGQQLVQRDTERVDVLHGAVLTQLAVQHLGRHVGQRSELSGGLRQVLPFLQARQAEVEQAGVAMLVDQDVGGFDVAMEHAVVVRVFEGVGRLSGDTHACVDPAGRDPRRSRARCRSRLLAAVGRASQEIGRRQLGKGSLAQLAQPLGQRRARDQLHAVVRNPPVLSGHVDRHDAGVLEASDCGHLAPEASAAVVEATVVRPNQLDRDVAPQLQVARRIHDAHAAAADSLEQIEVPDPSWQWQIRARRVAAKRQLLDLRQSCANQGREIRGVALDLRECRFRVVCFEALEDQLLYAITVSR